MIRSVVRSHGLRVMLGLAISLAVSRCSAADSGNFDAAKFKQDVQPILAQRCLSCHGPDKPEADLRLDTLNPDLAEGPDAETWHEVLNKLNLGEMPPERATPLSVAERQTVVDWLTRETQRAIQQRRSTDGKVVLRRLTRYEYNNTLRDLLGLDLDYAAKLPPESPSADGFKNNGAALGISPLQMELYLEAARMGLGKAIVTGERPQVYTHRAEKSEPDKRAKGGNPNELRARNRYLVRLLDFPREGEVLVRVRASTNAADDAPYPRMRVAMGVRADTQAPEKTLAEVDVTAPLDAPQTFELRGRIEDFPLPGHNPKFPGLQISIYNDLGAADTKRAKPKKKQDSAITAESASEPVIVIESVEFEGPLLSSWPPPSHSQLLGAPEEGLDETQRARQVLERFLTRAYRRPATAADVDSMLEYYEHVRSGFTSFEESMREVLAMSLISPEFLYLVEPRTNPAARERLSDYELASRLSYFLWSTMPDQQLFGLAAANKLHDPQVLATQVARMLADSKSRQFVQHFSDQWFDLSALERVAVNPEFYPEFDDRLKADMRIETQLFFATILDENRSSLQLLDADFTMLNRALAEHYGLTGPRGTRFERVALSPADRRGGLLTQGSFLLANSNGEDSHPIKRAVWLLDRLLDSPPAPPPPDVPELDADEPSLTGLPLKRQLEIHRQKEACNSCHRGIDPWGIALENYDAVGNWRETFASRKNGKKVESAAVDAVADLPDGTKVDGVEELKQYLLQQRRQQFAETIVKRLLTYSLGRSLEWTDRPEITTLTEHFTQSDYRLRPLIVAIVQSETFQSK